MSSCIISAKSDNRRPSYGDLTNLRWPQFAILDIRDGRTWTIPHVARPYLYAQHRIWWRHLDWRRRYAPKRNSKKRPPGGGILLSVPTLTPAILRGPSYMSSRKTSAKSDNPRPSYGDFTFLPYWPILGFSLRQRFSEMGSPPSLSWYHEVHPPSVLDKFFRFPNKSPNSK